MATATAKLADRIGVASLWTSSNPTLLAGERGVESDTKRFKIGDGSTAWNSLEYSTSGEHGAEDTVASATTCAIGATVSENVSITGTTTITGFGTVAAGTKRWGRFTGVLTLTHNGTSLILPGAANITTAAGDRFCAYSLGSGNWLVHSYTKANGEAVVGGVGGGGGGGEKWAVAFDGQGAVVASGVKAFRPVIASGTINKAAIVGDPSGSVTVTVNKYTPSAGALGSPTSLGTIALASVAQNSSTPSWAVSAGDVLEFTPGGTIATCTKVFVSLST